MKKVELESVFEKKTPKRDWFRKYYHMFLKVANLDNYEPLTKTELMRRRQKEK